TTDRQRIIIDEVPYNVNKARLIERIADLVNDKQMTGVSDIRDESDKQGMRIAIDLKRGEIPDVVINQLYKFTDMQVTFGCNMLALDKGLPRIMNIKQMIAAWVDHRIEVVRARTRYELNKAEARAHILEGYLKALDHLDDVVKIIRQSENREEAKVKLVEKYQFSDRQVNAVLDLRLYQLTGMEKAKIEGEYAELQAKIAHYRAVLASETLVRGIIKDELEEIQSFDKTERKTQIVPAEEEFQMEDLIADEPVILTISSDDYIKRMPISTFKEQRRGGQGVIGFDQKKETDIIKDLYVASTHDTLMFFTNFGRVYWVKVWQIPEGSRRSKGKPLVNLLEGLSEGEQVAAQLRVRNFQEEEASILLSTKKGVVKKTLLDSFSSPRRKGVYAINIDEGDEVISAHIVRPQEQIMLFTHEGMAVRFDQDQVRPMGRVARGVRGVKLKSPGDHVVSCEVVKGDETVLVVCENGFGKRSSVDQFRHTNRGGVGVRSIITSKRNGQVVGALSVGDKDSVVLMANTGQTIRLSMKDIRVMGRSTQGVKVVTLKNSDTLVAMQKIEHLEEEEAVEEKE
ncbi:MAG: DNA gyrase subunit A, partial [Chlamydiales bacterium]|nr:DNA gyrase subunit A [Chlamydiales bacterium]